MFSPRLIFCTEHATRGMKKLLGGLCGLGERSAGGNDLMGKPELIS